MRIQKWLSILFFFGTIAVFALLTLVLPKQSFSENENRTLTSFPTIRSVEDIMDRSFMKGFDNYISDHFAGRDQWIALKTQLDLLYGQKEVSGVYITPERLMQKTDTPNEQYINASINAINEYAQKYPDKTVSVLLVPTATEIYKEQLPKNAPELDQKLLIDSVYSQLTDSIVRLDAYRPLMAEKNNYIFYKTDHHWTSYGAFVTYSYNARSLGFNPLSLNDFQIEHASYNFLGTLHSKTQYTKTGMDTIDLYTNAGNVQVVSCIRNNGVEQTEYPSIFFREMLEKKDQYSVFLGTNEGIVTVKTNASNGKRLLMFKDSYSHALIQFLAPHYEEITLVDLRYLTTSYETYVDPALYDQVMFLYNVNSFITDSYIKNVTWSIQDQS
ncbi:MAG TPA: hypothetical protein H9671_08225 [Firmicutes bacterium]|nr:hypothetical protein [Bacillota bacterium]